jgi:hypothetical protein
MHKSGLESGFECHQIEGLRFDKGCKTSSASTFPDRPLCEQYKPVAPTGKRKCILQSMSFTSTFGHRESDARAVLNYSTFLSLSPMKCGSDVSGI